MATYPRAMNDYTADKVCHTNAPEKWVEPKKVALSISSSGPGWDIKPNVKKVNTEATSK